MEERKKPTRPFSVIYADAKQALTRQVGNTMAAYGLPIFMAEGILSGILAEIRTNAGNELADDTARYEEELKPIPLRSGSTRAIVVLTLLF